MRAASDLREWLNRASENGYVKTIKGAHPNLEIGAVTEVSGELDQKVLLFDEILGYPKGYRVVTNMSVSSQSIAMTLNIPTDLTSMGLIEQIEASLLKWERSVTTFPPREVSDGPLMENVQTGDDVNLEKFPTPFWRELDGGRYIGTGCAIIIGMTQ